MRADLADAFGGEWIICVTPKIGEYALEGSRLMKETYMKESVVAKFLKTAAKVRKENPQATLREIATEAEVSYEEYLEGLKEAVANKDKETIALYKLAFGRAPKRVREEEEEEEEKEPEEPAQEEGDYLDVTYQVVRLLEGFEPKVRRAVLTAAQTRCDIED
jgi:hypothetical protein